MSPARPATMLDAGTIADCDIEAHFSHPIRTAAQLRGIYGERLNLPEYRSTVELTPRAAEVVQSARLLFLASFSHTGRCDISPRGGKAGFTRILDATTLAIPDASGNRHVDTLHNIVQNGRIGVIFITPGDNLTLRVVGSAIVTDSPSVTGLFPFLGSPPLTVILVRIEECFLHCPKAFARSSVWQRAEDSCGAAES